MNPFFNEGLDLILSLYVSLMTIPKPLNYQLKYKVIYVVKEKLFQRLILPVKNTFTRK